MTQTEKKYRIVLIHATPVSIDPIQAAFIDLWPDANTVNILDDSLSKDLNSGDFERDLIEHRIITLGQYGEQIGADGILYSCSAFGREIEAAKKHVQIPVLKPNEAMFEKAIEIGGKIGLIATFKPSIPSMEKEFFSLMETMQKKIQLDSIFVEGAMTALALGDLETHNRLIQDASTVFAGYRAVMLAQFSASQASNTVEDQLGCTVLTSPLSAVGKLKASLLS